MRLKLKYTHESRDLNKLFFPRSVSTVQKYKDWKPNIFMIPKHIPINNSHDCTPISFFRVNHNETKLHICNKCLK